MEGRLADAVARATEMRGRLREKDERIGALETELDAARALGEDLCSRAEGSEGAANEARTMAAGLESRIARLSDEVRASEARYEESERQRRVRGGGRRRRGRGRGRK